MKIHFDEKSDAAHIRLDPTKKIMESQEVASGILLDFDTRGDVVGVEILGLKKRIPKDQFKKFVFQVV